MNVEIYGVNDGRLSICGSDPLVDILAADDIVLTQIETGLQFHKIERQLARTLQAAHAVNRHEDRFLLAQKGLLPAVDRDLVLGAAEVPLQRQPGSEINRDTLDLKALSFVHRVTEAPKAAYTLRMCSRSVAVLL